MISENQAKNLKVFLWSEISDVTLRKCPPDLIPEINRVIDKAISVAQNEPDILHLKNLIAFVLVMREGNFLDLSPKSIIEKLKRYCLSHKADEYKWGLSPSLYKVLYEYFDKYHLPLDSGEQKAKELENQFKQLNINLPIDRRWVDSDIK